MSKPNLNRRNILKAAAAGAVAAPLAMASSSAFATTNLRMQAYWGREAADVFAEFGENVRTASEGSIRVRHFTGSSLVPDAEMFQAVSRGTIDMCQGYGGYWPGQLDIAMIEGGLPGAWTSYDEAQYIFRHKGLTDLVREAYAEHNVHFMGPVFGGPFDLLTKSPVNSLDDLKNMRIRATPSVARILQAFDIPTVFLPASELYVGLSTGTIDGVIYAGTNEYVGMKLYEVAKHYTSIGMVYPGYCDQVLINMDVWNKMTDQQRKVMELAFETHASRMNTWMVSGSIDAGASGLFEMNKLPEADSQRLRQAASVIWEEEAAKSARNRKAIDILIEAAKATGRA